jgi:tRNA dimethylallyltransferase
MLKKVLIITGPTATGKTSLAINLAKKYNGEVVSADSRQVYEGMDIGTGKDLPKVAKLHWEDEVIGGYYLFGKVKVWGYDLVLPSKEFSVSQYIIFAQKVIKKIASEGKLPILVGGTGLYIKALLDGIPTAEVPQNKDLRDKLKDKSAGELFETLALLDGSKAGSLNSSDRKNPRRLVRAIEIATWKLSFGEMKIIKPTFFDWNSLVIGLSAPQKILEKKIESRADKRLAQGLKKEIDHLLTQNVTWDSQAMSSLGYKQWRGYYEKEIPLSLAINNWISEEKKYIKRQMTWFKKDSRINWFDISDAGLNNNVEKLVKKWYSTVKEDDKKN